MRGVDSMSRVEIRSMRRIERRKPKGRAMPDMSKSQPEDSDQRVADRPESISRLFQPGSKKWFWYKRAANAMLFALPLYPLWGSVMGLIDPGVLVRASTEGVSAKAPNGEATSVYVHLTDPSWLDYLLIAGPGLLGCVMLAVLCRALYRININFGTHSQPYTDRDFKILSRARWVTALMYLPLGALFLGGFIRYNGVGPFDTFSIIVLSLVLSAIIEYIKDIYIKGRTYYQELEKGV